jgi:hypothetical protein
MQIIAHEERERTPSPDSRLEVRIAVWDAALDAFKCVGCRRNFSSQKVPIIPYKMQCSHTACRDCLECKSTGKMLFECPVDGDFIDKVEAITTFDEMKRVVANPMDPMNKNNNRNPKFVLDSELFRKVKTRERLEV